MAALAIIRVAGRLVAMLAGTIGVVYAITAVMGQQVLVVVGSPVLEQWSLAIVLAVGSWLTSIAANVAGHAALIYPDGPPLSFLDITSLPIDWGLNAGTLTPDFAMLGLAVTLGLLAHIVRSGERLQRDVKGLV